MATWIKQWQLCLFAVTKGTKHGLCTLSKVEKGSLPKLSELETGSGQPFKVPDEAFGMAETLAPYSTI